MIHPEIYVETIKKESGLRPLKTEERLGFELNVTTNKKVIYEVYRFSINFVI